MIRRAVCSILLAAATTSVAQSAAQTPVQPPAVQPASPSPSVKPADATGKTDVATGEPLRAGTLRAQRKAAKLYLEAVKQLEKQRLEEAWNLLQQAVALDPANTTYAAAAELARQSLVTQLVQQSSRERETDKIPDGKPVPNSEPDKLLERALEIDPHNPLVLEHLNQLGEEVAGAGVGAQASAVIGSGAEIESGVIELEPAKTKHSFHLRSSSHQVIQEVFRAYGIEASVDDSVQSKPVRMEVDDATFPEAMHILALLTGSFYEPLDPHRAIVARDSREFRQQFQRMQMETVYLPGLDDKQLTDVSNLARNLFEVQQAVVEPTQSTITLRAPGSALNAFNRTIAPLEDGKNQLELDVKVIELAHVSNRETGATFFQQTGVYNVYSEINSILSQNQAAIQQIIASGLVPNANTLANQLEILAVLVSTGQVTGPPFNAGFLPFGGGKTESILSPGPATLTMSLNSSDTRMLDDIQMRLSDDETGTFKTGERYPIETSSYSSVALPAVAGVSSLASAAQSQTIPQIQYEDLGLTLKATPKVMRSHDVALTIELKIEALGGSSLNDIPILDNRQVSGVLTLRQGETAILASDLSRTESRALNGLPGVGDIPGLEDISDIQRDENVARLMILVTPRVLRETQQLAHGPRIPIDKGSVGR